MSLSGRQAGTRTSASFSPAATPEPDRALTNADGNNVYFNDNIVLQQKAAPKPTSGKGGGKGEGKPGTEAMPANRSGYLATAAATSSLVISGPAGPHQAQINPLRTPASSITATGPVYQITAPGLQLNMRTEAKVSSPASKNIRAVLPDGQMLTSLTGAPVNGFLEVQTLLDGALGDRGPGRPALPGMADGFSTENRELWHRSVLPESGSEVKVMV
jgi:hypothetical protein